MSKTSTRRKLGLAVAQMGPVHLADDRAAVVKRLVEMMREASARGSEFVVFPELALTTFFPRYWMSEAEAVERFFERSMPNADVQPLFDTARDLGIGFYLGYAEITPDGRRYNTAVLVDRTARIIGKYRKIHLPGHKEHEPWRAFQHLEKRYFEPGDLGFPVWRSMGGIMGMAICNDRRWPETYRVMSLKGVEIVMLGYNTPDVNTSAPEPNHLRMFHNHVVMQASAYQNSCFVVATAKAGIEDGCMLIGGSCIIQPSGEIVTQASTVEDELVTYACDLDLAKMGKETVFNFAKHRRIEHYGIITEQTGVIEPPME